MLLLSDHPRQRGGWLLEERLVSKFRVFGECALTIALIAVSLAVGFGAMSVVASQAMIVASAG